MVDGYVGREKNSRGELMGNFASSTIKTLAVGLLGILGKILFFLAAVFLIYFVFFCVFHRVTPFSDLDKLSGLKIKHRGYDFIRWFAVDFKRDRLRDYKPFEEYGFTVFVGRQGAGKTISMVEYLERMKRIYPDCIIVTNFKCSLADRQMNGWRDFFEIRNDDKGVIFAIDEIHSEYDSSKWKDFPESLLSEISQQRKQRVKIVATSQCFKRIVKPMREQTFSVVECKTFFKRWTFCTEYDAFDYENLETSYVTGNALKPLKAYNYVQSDKLRNCYDTYEKIERLEKAEFIPRSERGGNSGVNIRRIG